MGKLEVDDFRDTERDGACTTLDAFLKSYSRFVGRQCWAPMGPFRKDLRLAPITDPPTMPTESWHGAADLGTAFGH